MTANENKLFLSKLSDYYGFELKIVDLNKFNTYKKFIIGKKKIKSKNYSFKDKSKNFVAFFADKGMVILAGHTASTIYGAIVNLKNAYIKQYSVCSLPFNYAHRKTAHMFKNNWLDVSSISEIELLNAIKNG